MTNPLPLTAAMLAVANENAAKPRYTGAAVLEDWHGADVGNDVDVAAATQSIANSGSADIETDYHPQHQEEKSEEMVPPLEILGDLGMDYGEFTGQTSRTGTIEPHMPYPEAEVIP